MGPAADLHVLEAGDEATPRRDRAKFVKNMTEKEYSILTKVFYEAHCDVQRCDPASPTGYSKARKQQVRPLLTPMEASSPTFSTATTCSPFGTGSISSLLVTQANSPSGSLGESNTDQHGLPSLKRKVDDDETTKRLWQKYPAVMTALEGPSIMNMIVNKEPEKQSPMRSRGPPIQREQKRTPQRKTPKKPRSRKKTIKKEILTSAHEFANIGNLPMETNFPIYGAPYYGTPFEDVYSPTAGYPWPQYPVHYHHPGTAASEEGTGLSGEANTSFYQQQPYTQPGYQPLPSVNTLLPYFPNICDPLPVLDLSDDDLDFLPPGQSFFP